LYGCETWSLTLKEELRLRVFENKVLRRIFGSKRGEVTGEWRKLPYIKEIMTIIIIIIMITGNHEVKKLQETAILGT
jgi:hypothetical protein